MPTLWGKEDTEEEAATWEYGTQNSRWGRERERAREK
jgi:hypothetical protein